MNIFTAHKREVNGRVEIQTVFEHSRGTADLGERYAEKIDTPVIARMQGMIHDAGKLCRDFNDYILEKNNFTRGMIDHCYAGARYLMELAKKTGDPRMVEVARYISHTVISHHGLHDWIDKDGNDYFRERISKDERYEEIRSNLIEMLSEQEWLNLLYAVKEEYMVIRGNYICLFDYLFISSQMSAKPYFIGSTGIFSFVVNLTYLGLSSYIFSIKRG